MKYYQQFITEITQQDIDKAAPTMSPEKRRAAFEKNARNQAKRTTPATPQKPKAALPPGKPGGSMEKRPSSALVAPPKPKSGALVAPKKPGANSKTYSDAERRTARRGTHRGAEWDEKLKQTAADKRKADDARKKAGLDKMAREKSEKESKENRKKWMDRAKAAAKFGKDTANLNQNEPETKTSSGASTVAAQRRTKGLI